MNLDARYLPYGSGLVRVPAETQLPANWQYSLKLREDIQNRVVDKHKRRLYEMLGKNGGPSEKRHAQDGSGTLSPTLRDEYNRCLRTGYLEEYLDLTGRRNMRLGRTA
jgi:hypothetical protein